MTVESLYNSSKLAHDSKVSSYVERFTKELLDVTMKGVFKAELWIDDADYSYLSGKNVCVYDDEPRAYIFESIAAIKEKYSGITVLPEYENGYIIFFTVSWDVGILFDLSKSVNDTKVSSYVDKFTKELLDATRRGVFQTQLWIDEADISTASDKNVRSYDDEPRPYILESMEAIKKKYTGITETPEYEDNHIIFFTVSWNEGPLYDITNTVNETMAASYLEIFMKEIIDATKAGRYSTKLVVPESEFDYDTSDSPNKYIFTAIRAIEEAYSGIKINECKDSNGYLKHFRVNWDILCNN